MRVVFGSIKAGGEFVYFKLGMMLFYFQVNNREKNGGSFECSKLLRNLWNNFSVIFN